jgi:hypothetical protein
VKADRGLVGVIGIALVVSTVVTLFIIGESGGPYSIVKSEYGPSGRGRWLAGISLLAKEPIGSLKLSHYCLMKRNDHIETVRRDGPPEEVAERIPNLKSYLDMSRNAGVEPLIHSFKVKIPRWENPSTLLQEEFNLYLYDFSKLVWQAIPDDLMHSMNRPNFGRGHLWDYYNAFACLYNEAGNLTHFFGGVSDFFLSRVIIIEELTIQKEAEKVIYHGVAKEEVGSEVLSILGSPERGVVIFEELERNDHVSVVYSMDSSKLPLGRTGLSSIPWHSVLHIVEIRVDEASAEYVVNIHDPPAPAPPD